MSKISKIPYQKKVFSAIRTGILVLKSPFFANSLLSMEMLVQPNYCFSENYSAVHLINSVTFIDLLSLHFGRKIDFGLFFKHIPSG